MKTMMTTMIMMNTAMWMMKSTKFMIMNLCIYTIMCSLMMSKKIKTTIMPFIMIMTILGGLMILFLYLTATKETPKSKKHQKMTPMMMVMVVMMTLMIPQLNKMPVKQNMDPIEPTMALFNKNMTMQMSMIMMMIMMTMVSIIWSCSTINKPLRQKIK